MEKDIEVKLRSTVLARINSVRMSRAERQVAMNAMGAADVLADALVWLAKKVEQAKRLVLTPALKH